MSNSNIFSKPVSIVVFLLLLVLVVFFESYAFKNSAVTSKETENIKVIKTIPISSSANLQVVGGSDTLANFKYKDANEYRFHNPEEFYEILEKSAIKYIFDIASDLTPYTFIKESLSLLPINPGLCIKYTGQDSFSIIEAKVSPDVESLLVDAIKHLKNNNFDKVIDTYKKALLIDSSYFKAYTLLGDSYYLNGNYDSAEIYLKKAIELNEIDYQAYFFLADVYLKKGNLKNALTEITHAFMLNKNSTIINGRLNDFLEPNGLQINKNRLKFPFELNQVSDTLLSVKFGEDQGIKWMPMAMCLACWKMEPDFKELIERHPDSLNFEIQMYKECMANQWAAILYDIEQDSVVTDTEMTLYSIIEDGYLNAIVYWEIMTTKYPMVILTMPKEEKQKVVEYIEKYVYTKRNP